MRALFVTSQATMQGVGGGVTHTRSVIALLRRIPELEVEVLEVMLPEVEVLVDTLPEVEVEVAPLEVEVEVAPLEVAVEPVRKCSVRATKSSRSRSSSS